MVHITNKNEIAAHNWVTYNTAGVTLGTLQILAHLIPTTLILEVGNSILILQGSYFKMSFIILFCIYGA